MMKKKLERLWKRREEVDGGREEERKNKRGGKEGRGGKRRGEFFWNLSKGWASEKKKKTHLNVWFGLG